jgi:hypothetical protein
MQRTVTLTLALSAALTLASPVLADSSDVTLTSDGRQAVTCVDAKTPRAALVAELKAQAAIVRDREASRVYGHEAHAPESMGGNQLRVASYSGGRMQPHRIATWGEHDAATGREVSCVRVMESTHRS